MTEFDKFFWELEKNKLKILIKDPAKNLITVILREWSCEIKINTEAKTMSKYCLGDSEPEVILFDGSAKNCCEKIFEILNNFEMDKINNHKLELLQQNKKKESIFHNIDELSSVGTRTMFQDLLITSLKTKYEEIVFDENGHVVLDFPNWKTKIIVVPEQSKVFFDIFLEHRKHNICVRRDVYNYDGSVANCRDIIDEIVKDWKNFVWKVRKPHELNEWQIRDSNYSFALLWKTKSLLDKTYWPLKGEAENIVSLPTIDELFLAIKSKFSNAVICDYGSTITKNRDCIQFSFGNYRNESSLRVYRIVPAKKGIEKSYNYRSGDGSGTCDIKLYLYDGSIEDCLRVLGEYGKTWSDYY